MARKRRRKQHIYEVTIEGEYFKGENQTSSLEPYKETIKLNEDHKEAGFLSVWKNLVAPRLMPAKYKGYGGLHTHHLVSVVDLDDPEALPNDPTLMNLDQLVAFINHNEMPVEISLYQDEDALRQAVVECIEDEESFLIGQDKRQSARGNQVGLTQGINDLNPELGVGLESRANADKIDAKNIPDLEEVEVPSDRAPRQREQTDEFTAEELGVRTKKSGKAKPSGRQKSKISDDDDLDDL